MRSHRVSARLRCGWDEDMWKRQYTLDCLTFRLSVLFLAAAVAHAGSFQQEVAHAFTTRDGLPSDDVVSVAVVNGQVIAKTSGGAARFSEGRWSRESAELPAHSNFEVTDSRGKVW